MSKKTFLICKILTVIILGAVVGFLVDLGHWPLPVVCTLAAFGFLWVCQKRVKGVIADERDYKIAGQAARAAFTIYSMVMVIIGLIVVSLSKSIPEYELPAHIILYSVCALVLLYAVLFAVYKRRGDK